MKNQVSLILPPRGIVSPRYTSGDYISDYILSQVDESCNTNLSIKHEIFICGPAKIVDFCLFYTQYSYENSFGVFFWGTNSFRVPGSRWDPAQNFFSKAGGIFSKGQEVTIIRRMAPINLIVYDPKTEKTEGSCSAFRFRMFISAPHGACPDTAGGLLFCWAQPPSELKARGTGFGSAG